MASRPFTLVAAGAIAATALALASTATAQNTTRTSDVGSCPSDDTVMTSNWYGSTKGYLCAVEDHTGNRSLSAWNSATFTSTVNISYYPQYHCWDSSDDKYMSFASAEIFGSGSVTVTNGGTSSHKWGAGYLSTLGAGTVTGWQNGCGYGSDVWDNPPNLLRLTNISATGLPDGGQSKAGVVSYTIKAQVSPGSYAAGAQVALKDNGTAVAGGVLDANGYGTFTWVPAEMGSHKIEVGWPGASGALGSITDAYTINVSGGVGTKIASPVTDNGDGTGTAAVTVETTPTSIPDGLSVVLVDANAKNPKTGKAPNPVGKAPIVPPASGTSTSVKVGFSYTGGAQMKLLALVQDAAGTPYGQSYAVGFKGATIVNATIPATAYASSTSAGCQPVNIPVTINPASATGTVSASGGPAATLSGGAATAQWCPPTAAGNSTVSVAYGGDAATPGATSAAGAVTVSTGGPTLKVNSTSWSAFTYVSGKGYVTTPTTTSVSATGLADGTTVKLVNGSQFLGSATLSNGSATITWTAPEYSTKMNLAAQATPATQTFVSPVSSVTSPCYSQCTKERSSGTDAAVALERTPRVQAELVAPPAPAAQPAAQEENARRARKPRGNPGESDPGDLQPVSTETQSITRSTKVTSSRRSVRVSCPKGYFPLHSQGSTNGPDPDIAVAVDGRTVTMTSPAGNRGSRLYADVTCRAASSRALVVGPMGFGTRGRDTLRTTLPNGTIFAGPGPDRVVATGRSSSAWGGQGRDRMFVRGAGSTAAGGPGADRIVAAGPGRILVWGGLGRDTLVGGSGTTLLNAMDGAGGDRVICRSAANRVMLDPGDTTSGPCRVVSPR